MREEDQVERPRWEDLRFGSWIFMAKVAVGSVVVGLGMANAFVVGEAGVVGTAEAVGTAAVELVGVMGWRM